MLQRLAGALDFEVCQHGASGLVEVVASAAGLARGQGGRAGVLAVRAAAVVIASALHSAVLVPASAAAADTAAAAASAASVGQGAAPVLCGVGGAFHF